MVNINNANTQHRNGIFDSNFEVDMMTSETMASVTET